jgi:hypothetical protein
MVAGWTSKGWSLANVEKVRAHSDSIDAKEQEMLVLLEEERLVFGIPGNREQFDSLKTMFFPHGELWETVHEVKEAKKEWGKSKLHTINPDEVDNLIKQKA